MMNSSDVSSANMPALFVGHGSPMNALEDNPFSRAWVEMGTALPRPGAILVVSAHWETQGTRVTAMRSPRTIHDFWGFPRALYEMQYPAAGAPELAERVCEMVKSTVVEQDLQWGLDHGAWSVLCRMFPAADIPVVQLSLDATQTPDFHYRVGRDLLPLRKEGVLILGSGNLVHNLRLMNPYEEAFDWAARFDQAVSERILSGEHEDLIHYARLGEDARLAIPTHEHYSPLLYILGLQEEGESIQFFAEGYAYGSISMRSVRIG